MDVPQTLGKYEIRGTLGRGAMGVVHDGWDPLIARRVAIKSVPLPVTPDAETAEEIARFRREAQAAGRLTHPNIVGVYDYGETSDIAYIVMEFVDGPTLKSLLDKKERFPLDSIGRIMADLLAGLQFSHERGVVHRDIKPANVMLTSQGQAKIADFGIARIEMSSMTQAGTMLGTPAYMSPEQFRGEAADARTDVYSSGVLLYQLLTGERPFEGGLTAIMHKALNTEPPAPSQLSGSVPHAVDAVVQKAMAKRPADRFASAAAFAEALRAALNAPATAAAAADGEAEATLVRPTRPAATAKPIAAPPPPPPPPAAASGGSKLPLVAGIAAVVVVIAAGAGWFLTRSPAPPPAQTAEATAPPATPTAKPAEPQPAPAPQPTATETPATPPAPPPQPAEPTVAPVQPAPTPATTAAAPEPAPAPAPVSAPAATTPEPAVAAVPVTPPAPATPPAPVVTAAAEPPAPIVSKPAEPPPAPPPPPPPPKATAPAVVPVEPPAPKPAVPAATPPAPIPSPAPATTTQATPPPAPVQPPQPAPHSETVATIAPAAMLQQISQALHGASCALAGATLQDGGGAAVHGFVGSSTADSLRRAVDTIAGTQPVGWNVKPVDPVFCPALALLRPISPASGGLSPGIGVALAAGRTVLKDGEAILPRLTMPDFAGELRVDYFAHDGTLAHLYPTLADPGSKLNAQPARKLGAGEHLALGDPGPGRPQWQSGEPYGTDMIIAVASSVPLKLSPAQNAEEKADGYLASLAHAIEQARAAGARVSGGLLLVDAVPKAK